MTYPSVVSAVVRALAAETINSAGGCDFEPKVQVARVPGEISGKEAAFLSDCWVHGRLHKALPVGLWLALVAKYSTHLERKHDAMMALAGSVKSPAPERFIIAATATWAFPKLPGMEGKRSTSVLPASWYDMDRWSEEPVAERTQHRWKSAIRRDLEDQVNKALVEAQHILDMEGLISCQAA
ncbi:hypothetical protein [Pelagibacterium sp.]|uniref:hypothetical protein n=1 Tax=Pelagibacterium sp. TaxID=1967288 RepID=UPI003A94EAA7